MIDIYRFIKNNVQYDTSKADKILEYYASDKDSVSKRVLYRSHKNNWFIIVLRERIFMEDLFCGGRAISEDDVRRLFENMQRYDLSHQYFNVKEG